MKIVPNANRVNHPQGPSPFSQPVRQITSWPRMSNSSMMSRTDERLRPLSMFASINYSLRTSPIIQSPLVMEKGMGRK